MMIINMRKFKLIKEYPGSPELGTIVENRAPTKVVSYYVYNLRAFLTKDIENNPEFWEEIIDDFVLPEKWCIKRNDDNEKVITDYINNYSEHNHKYLRDNKYNPYMHIGKGCCSAHIVPNGYTEITFEQFKKYVLKEEEKVVEKDYEIISFIDINSYIYKKDTWNFPENYYLNRTEFRIHSVKRLSDGEIFTIGDLVGTSGVYPIAKFKIHDIENTILVSSYKKENSSGHYNCRLKNLIKAKQPLFTTEDGVDIFENSKGYYCVDDMFKIAPVFNEAFKTSKTYKQYLKHPTNKRFSTKEKAEEYILMNKPVLSLSDVWDHLSIKNRKLITPFVKQKLNK